MLFAGETGFALPFSLVVHYVHLVRTSIENAARHRRPTAIGSSPDLF
jgi:hypothetical protein